ncbi:OsmC family protein [Aromatoleum petrolei]|uniref:OsmC-like protein n=1 Tax=Aromatoleum petrolei TaxID=76116 RepID=A0ABX1MVB4_9RHOO|nr:OsmC family protein [Aromatoleum petrolei]NMF89919.1 hypothetical protein [Aromatoleum petrolei]
MRVSPELLYISMRLYFDCVSARTERGLNPLKEWNVYSVTVEDNPQIIVTSGKHEIRYAVNGSDMNPLEAFYATLAGCAAVYAKKACKELGVSAAGIHIESRPFAGPRGPLTLHKFKTEVSFPEGFSDEQRARVLDSIAHCAVKEIVSAGAEVEFAVIETQGAAAVAT